MGFPASVSGESSQMLGQSPGTIVNTPLHTWVWVPSVLVARAQTRTFWGEVDGAVRLICQPFEPSVSVPIGITVASMVSESAGFRKKATRKISIDGRLVSMVKV